ncbi:peroxide stress protein YaaA [Corynebacterium sp. HS2168-gen11]|uniref:peroxide stress protein YaaA n=1 Tax=Corynebacterium sp. HS2168-gen11 TaxID=2974027 RepID=UPI00216AF0D1|nr:peroxide stress protein YaaA [Corynebacterium sp. HS2168-gen11]MCS4536313.1 peroxide stress protein YaaA [Corynebacterium sp. HS2168-gen11]
MLIILPPSETKAHGGHGTPLDFSTLAFPELSPIREDIAADLAALDEDEALIVLKISEKLRREAASNRMVLHSPTMPAIERFTGVLYDALDASSLDTAARSRLVIGDAFFGLVMAEDCIPHYRLSGSTKLPRRTSREPAPTMKRRWGTAIYDVLHTYEGLIVDLRSGTYQQLGKAPQAFTVRVESIQPDGSRKVINHFNKHYKGVLARVLAQAEKPAQNQDDIIQIAADAGLILETTGSQELILVIPKP